MQDMHVDVARFMAAPLRPALLHVDGRCACRSNCVGGLSPPCLEREDSLACNSAPNEELSTLVLESTRLSRSVNDGFTLRSHMLYLSNLKTNLTIEKQIQINWLLTLHKKDENVTKTELPNT